MHGVGGADCSILKLDVNLYQQDKPKPLTKTILPRVFPPGTDSLKKINPEPTQENYFPEASVIRPDWFEAIDHLFSQRFLWRIFTFVRQETACAVHRFARESQKKILPQKIQDLNHLRYYNPQLAVQSIPNSLFQKIPNFSPCLFHEDPP